MHEASIRSLSLQEAEDAVDKLLDSVNAFASVDGALADPKEERARRLRLKNTRKIAGQLNEGADFVLGCFLRGPIGLVTLNRLAEGAALEVEDFVTHPQSAGAGGALTEDAATVSQQQGCGGCLVLAPHDGSRGFYEAMGFVDDGRGMRLDPSSQENADRWQLQNDEWRLKKYLAGPLKDRPRISMRDRGPDRAGGSR